jgi:hypothetical protein
MALIIEYPIRRLHKYLYFLKRSIFKQRSYNLLSTLCQLQKKRRPNMFCLAHSMNLAGGDTRTFGTEPLAESLVTLKWGSHTSPFSRPLLNPVVGTVSFPITHTDIRYFAQIYLFPQKASILNRRGRTHAVKAPMSLGHA